MFAVERQVSRAETTQMRKPRMLQLRERDGLSCDAWTPVFLWPPMSEYLVSPERDIEQGCTQVDDSQEGC